LQMVAERIIETGVTSLLPTIITQEKSVYPKLLSLLKPFSTSTSATLLGWHAEGPFIDLTKRGAHAPAYLLAASSGFRSFEEVYGSENLVEAEDWMMSADQIPAVRLITAAPEVPGVMEALSELNKRGVAFSIGHSVASSEVATTAVLHGARLITHLFNAMPQLHHRDPSIIGLLGASPHLYSPTAITAHLPCNLQDSLSFLDSPSPLNGSHNSSSKGSHSPTASSEVSEGFQTIPSRKGTFSSGAVTPITPLTPLHKKSRPSLHLEKGQIADMAFERPYYGIIVDGIHCHPNSVRLAYSSHPEGCILITDAMKILDPKLQDGVHEWQGGRKFVKEGERLYLEGTTTLAGSVVTLDKCVRNFSSFTGCSLGEAIKCATYNPAKCLGIENKKGTLRPGAHADLVVLNRQGIVLSTWIRGKQAWPRKA